MGVAAAIIHDDYIAEVPVQGALVWLWPTIGDRKRQTLAWVQRADEKTIDCVSLQDGIKHTGVRYREDPRCKDENIRENGCWDFTEADKVARGQIADMKELVQRQTAEITSLKGVIGKQYSELRSSLSVHGEAISKITKAKAAKPPATKAADPPAA